MRSFLLPPIAAALLAAPVIALAKEPPATQASADQAARMSAIGQRGRLLFDLDRAAWVATDDFVAKVGDLSKTDGKGYVTEREGEGFIVTFYAGEPGSEVAIYVGHVAGGRVVSGRLLNGGDRTPLTPGQARLAAARRAGQAAGLRPCTAAPFNVTAVPPSSADQPLELYLTSAQVENGVYPFGGHYLLTVGPDGQVISTRKFTNSCLNMPLPRTGPGGAVPAAAVVSHLLDPTPTEIHVFMSITIGKPVYVVTSDPERIWVVNGESVALAGPKDKMAKAIRSRR
jgi:hypothetical protein